MSDRPPFEIKNDAADLPADQRPCMGCAQNIVDQMVGEHGKTAGLNTILAAVRLFAEAHVRPEMRPSMLQAAGEMMRAYASEIAAESTDAIGPAQGRA